MSKHDDALRRKLEQKQAEHGSRLADVDSARAKLDQKTAKLGALEASIAKLERRLAAPRALTLGQEDPHDGRLTRAVLIFNPWSGKEQDNGVRLAWCVSRLREHGIDADVKLKTSGPPGGTPARRWKPI